MTSKVNTKIIMIHSYKGGTGKTAIAVNLARYLALKEKRKILLIEQDTGGSSFSNIFYVNPSKVWNDFYLSNASLQDLVVRYKDFDIICAREQEVDIPKGEKPELFYSRHLERFKWEKKWLQKHYEIILLDTHPGYSIDLINSVVVADIALLVSRLDADTIGKTIDMYERIYALFKNKRIILIQNQIPEPVNDQLPSEPDRNVKIIMDRWSEFIKDKTLVSIPLKNEIAYVLSQSKILPFNNILMTFIKQISDLINSDTTS